MSEAKKNVPQQGKVILMPMAGAHNSERLFNAVVAFVRDALMRHCRDVVGSRLRYNESWAWIFSKALARVRHVTRRMRHVTRTEEEMNKRARRKFPPAPFPAHWRDLYENYDPAIENAARAIARDWLDTLVAHGVENNNKFSQDEITVSLLPVWANHTVPLEAEQIGIMQDDLEHMFERMFGESQGMFLPPVVCRYLKVVHGIDVD